MLNFQRYIILALVMGLLLVQIHPAISRKSKSSKSESSSSSTSEESTEEEEPSEETETAAPSVAPSESSDVSIDIVGLSNFLVQGFFDFFIGILSAIGICIPQCAVAEDCINCFAVTFPPPPAVPADIINAGNAQVM